MVEPTKLGFRPQSVPRGTQLNNMFEIERLLASGGMGEVYQGRNIETGDPVAIKLVLPEFAQDEMILQLFRKEARILNHLFDEAIVRYYVFSVDKALARPFLAMEYVDGHPLSERIKSGQIDAASVTVLKNRLAKGLQQAHAAGIIHRDIAPDNIILPEGRIDRAKIIDFGIAKSAAVGGGSLLGGNFAGKYNFVSPEQLGLFGGQVTHLSDIYSLGLVLAACLRGNPLDMGGTQLQIIEKRRVVPDLSGLETDLRALLEAMLQPDPSHRPGSMAEVAAWPAFRQAATGRAVTGGTQKPSKHVRRASHQPAAVRSTAATAVLVLSVAALLLGGGAAYYYVQNPPAQITAKSQPSVSADQSGAEASLHTAAAAPARDPSLPPTRREIATFLREYAGGDCFLALPVTVEDKAVSIVGYGHEEPFRRLLLDFKNRFGFEPAIHLQLVAETQCIVIGAAARLSGDAITAPALELDREIVRSGQTLSGTLSDLGDHFVEVLVIDNQGLVQRLIQDPAGSRMSFEAQLQGELSQPEPQLVLAIASSVPLLSLGRHWPRGYIPAAQLVPELLKEVEVNRAQVAVAVRSFTFGG